ncbi:MAG: immunoglobulin domain-containing protein [Limisphaerales bacterium]
MRITLKTLGCLLTLGLLTFSARASILLNDNFDSYATGSITNVSANAWFGISGVGTSPLNIIATGDAISSPNMALVAQTNAQDVAHNFAGNAVYSTNNVTNLYVSFVINLSVLTTNTGSAAEAYFATFYSTNGTGGGYFCRIWTGITNASPGSYRLGIANNSSTPIWFPMDLSPGSDYTVVARYVPSLQQSTLWVTNYGSAINDVSPSVNAADVVSSQAPIGTFAFRQNSGEGMVEVDNLLVGTGFGDVISGSANPPVILTQPQDTNVFAGAAAAFSVFADGDATLAYQWYFTTNNIQTNAMTGATSSTVTFSSLTTNQSGFYFAVITNAAGTNVTRMARLTVNPLPIPPTITNQPANTTCVLGDTVSLTVGAYGLPAVAYQWKYITNNGVSLITNNVTGANVSGANSATLTFTSILTNQSGTYFVNITNASTVGYTQTNSALVTVTVNPIPTLTIAQVRAKVDGSYNPTNTTSLYTIQGTVTTWTNMTSSGNTEFYMQDSTAGICVFWSGANSTNRPPAGAIVQVTGPMAVFDGLLELEPYFTNTLEGVKVLSTNTLPVAQPLPFDPNITGNLATMKAMESTYFVASNVTLAAGPTFVSGANEPITANASNVLTAPMYSLTFTNLQGEQFTMYINGYTDIPGQPKPSGPVTIYGVLGYFTAVGFEFTPSRYADIISYIHQTNVLSNLVRQGDLPVNSFVNNFLLPGETLTTYVSIGDPEGGSVTLTPITTGLPASAYWDGITSGLNAAAVFHFTPTTGDASSNYVVSLAATSTSGNAFTNTFSVYVPTPVEQHICISEIFANPTTNASSPAFNPLQRGNDAAETSVSYDAYVEIANLSAADKSLANWTIGNGSSVLHTFNQFNSLEAVASSNAFVVYGGPANADPSPPTILGGYPGGYIEPMNTLETLSLSTNGGVLTLNNAQGYMVDRVAYPASSLNTSFSRFPTVNGALVPQAYISTNYTSAGLQYDASPWNSPPQIPKGVNHVAVSVINNQAVLSFTAVPNRATTLWSATDLTVPFTVIFGQPFSTTAGVFSVTNLPAYEFYFITTQTNH